MYNEKMVLLIGGGGTLGSYTAQELLRLGSYVDVICLEDKSSDDPHLRFFQGLATLEYLKSHLAEHNYDGIINFLHYPDIEEYKPVHTLLSANTSHLIFLSSYRVYADLEHPITESAPLLIDTIDDSEFLQNETYAVSKAVVEKYIREQSGTNNFTIVRPVISFSDKRLDVVTLSRHEVIERTIAGDTVLLPSEARRCTAGLDWANNTGKLIAHVLFKPQALGQAYTVSTAQELTWGDVADIYTRLIGTRFEWISTEELLRVDTQARQKQWLLKYDRLYDRSIDNSKLLEATGLTRADFKSIEEGIAVELTKLGIVCNE